MVWNLHFALPPSGTVDDGYRDARTAIDCFLSTPQHILLCVPLHFHQNTFVFNTMTIVPSPWQDTAPEAPCAESAGRVLSGNRNNLCKLFGQKLSHG